MLATRILTAAVLIPLVLAAMFLLPPMGWGAVTLALIAVASTEWADLAGYRGPTWWMFLTGTLLIGGNLLAFAAGRIRRRMAARHRARRLRRRDAVLAAPRAAVARDPLETRVSRCRWRWPAGSC